MTLSKKTNAIGIVFQVYAPKLQYNSTVFLSIILQFARKLYNILNTRFQRLSPYWKLIFSSVNYMEHINVSLYLNLVEFKEFQLNLIFQ